MCNKKIRNVIVISISIILLVFTILLIIILPFTNGQIENIEHVKSIQELMNKLDDKYYYFEYFNDNSNIESYYLTTDTHSSRKKRKGEYKYIGYKLYGKIAINDNEIHEDKNKIIYFTIEATTNTNLINYAIENMQSNKNENISYITNIVTDIYYILEFDTIKNICKIYFISNDISYLIELQHSYFDIDYMKNLGENIISSKYKKA